MTELGDPLGVRVIALLLIIFSPRQSRVFCAQRPQPKAFESSLWRTSPEEDHCGHRLTDGHKVATGEVSGVFCCLRVDSPPQLPWMCAIQNKCGPTG